MYLESLWQGDPLVSIALSQFCYIRVRRSSLLLWSSVSSELTLSVMDSRPHLLHNLPLPFRLYTGTNLYCLVTEAQGCEQLA